MMSWLSFREGRARARRRTGSVLGQAEVPVEEDVLALGVAHHALAVPTELGVVGRHELETGLDAVAEPVDHGPVAEVALDLPVRRHGAEVDHSDVALRRLRWGFGLDLRHVGNPTWAPLGHRQPPGPRQPPRRPRVTVIVRRVPLRSTTMRTLSPGSWLRIAAPRSSLPVIGVPSTDTMTSPTFTPALPAARSGSTSCTNAPSSAVTEYCLRTSSLSWLESTSTVPTPRNA